MGLIKVVCGIIFNDGKVLICRRKPEKSLGGYWEFPGGKIEDGESDEVSLVRELIEELGMNVKVDHYFKTNIHAYEKFTIELVAYKCQFIDSNDKLIDHDVCEWINVKDLKKFNLAPADIPLALELMLMYGD